MIHGYRPHRPPRPTGRIQAIVDEHLDALATALQPADLMKAVVRPPGFDKERYKKRNTVERSINKLKQSRAVVPRYDKRGYVFLGTVTVAAIVIWLRS